MSIPGFPEDLNDLGDRLSSYGFTFRNDGGGAWTVIFPPGHPGNLGEAGFYEQDLATGLMRILRDEETRRGVLFRYEQFDQRWGRLVYGNRPDDTTIGQAGCGPTSVCRSDPSRSRRDPAHMREPPHRRTSAPA